MELLYPIVVGVVVLLGLYASGALAWIARRLGGPSRVEVLMGSYAALVRAALEARHAIDQVGHRGSLPGDGERLQHSLTRLQLALQPLFEGGSEGTVDAVRGSMAAEPPALLRLHAAASEAQRALQEARARSGSTEGQEGVSAALYRVEQAMVPLAVEPLARAVFRAAEAFYQDCLREASAPDDLAGDLRGQLIGASYTALSEAIQESSALLLGSSTPPRQLK